jgi:hypothetical protein
MEKTAETIFIIRWIKKCWIFYAYNSAKYEVKRDKWKNINIEIYYHKGTSYNLERMISGVKNRWSTTRQTSVPSTTRFELWNIQEH